MYLLEFNSFRVLAEDNVVYKESEESLPLLLEPWQRYNKLMSFIFEAEEQFPVSQGIHECELLLWDEEQGNARFSRRFRFDITADVLDTYKKNREVGSTSLQSIHMVGYTPLKSRKLTQQEYELLR